jgi:hypothetical protein
VYVRRREKLCPKERKQGFQQHRSTITIRAYLRRSLLFLRALSWGLHEDTLMKLFPPIFRHYLSLKNTSSN